jgi:hypothetical protein
MENENLLYQLMRDIAPQMRALFGEFENASATMSFDLYATTYSLHKGVKGGVSTSSQIRVPVEASVPASPIGAKVRVADNSPD